MSLGGQAVASGLPEVATQVARDRVGEARMMPSETDNSGGAAQMDRGTIELPDLAAEVANGTESVWGRAVLAPEGDLWAIASLEAVTGERARWWRELDWEYPEVVFVAALVERAALVACLTEATAAIRIGKYGATTTGFQTSNQWNRRPSRSSVGYTPLVWPSTEFDVHPLPKQGSSQAWSPPDGLLVGEGAPTFPTFAVAHQAFWFGNYSTITSVGTFSPAFKIRVQHMDARLDHIRIRPTNLTVAVEGLNTADCRIELGGSTTRGQGESVEQSPVQIPLPDGLPDDAWLYLTRGDQWLDYRVLGERIGWKGDLEAEGVEIEHPEDPLADLEALISAGEGPHIEYKEKLPGPTEEEKRRALKTVAAFANGEGGQLLFGVDDDGKVVGIEDLDESEIELKLAHLIRHLVWPTPQFKANRVRSADGLMVVVLRVEPGTTRPYGLMRSPDGPVEHYIRRGGSSFYATAAEVRELARAGMAAVLG